MKAARVSNTFRAPGIDEVREEYTKLADSSDYEHYVEYRTRIDAAMEEPLSRVAVEAEAAYSAVLPKATSHQRVAKSAQRRLVWLLVGGTIALVVAIIVLIVLLVNGPVDLATVAATIAAILGLLASVSSLVSRLQAVRAKSSSAIASLKSELQSTTSALIKDAFTQVLNATLGPENKLPFPTVAPRLVELHTSAVVASRTATFLKNFVEGHESSAIGIAGPRGSGKSTLMRGLATDAKHVDRSVWLTAPVRYDSVDFIRRLYLEVARKVDDKHGGEFGKFQRRKSTTVLVARASLGLFVSAIGAALFALESWSFELSVVQATATVLTVSGLVMALLSYIKEWRGSYSLWRSGEQHHKQSAIQAKEALTRLSYDSETNTKRKNVVKFLAGNVSLEDENSVTLKDRALSHADLVTGLRKLLKAFADDEKRKPIIVVIDELDKISLTSDLIDTVNDLKDLFHIEGVHFVVSVSTDALSSFEQRGLFTRDAFDSSFDTIISVETLSLDESLQVISKRAEGFPPLVGAFCHAWSGGLPRELLRVARRCVEIQRSTKESQPVELLVRKLVAEDIKSLVEAALRSTEAAAEREHLWQLRERAKSLLDWRVTPMNITDYPRTLQNIASIVALGEGLCLYFATSVRVGTAKWSNPDPVRGPLEAAAKAMAQRGEPHELRQEAFERATAALSCGESGVIGTDRKRLPWEPSPFLGNVIRLLASRTPLDR
ncbi:P-loop NTPase fold protein [Arthrobacter sp. NPDC093125]|uniref:P-loop NTPase fold protein n=1 Tax=Arthrobacter sp. NPDC093125 TaxID=3363944 RepID=UPI0037FAE9EB